MQKIVHALKKESKMDERVGILDVFGLDSAKKVGKEAGIVWPASCVTHIKSKKWHLSFEVNQFSQQLVYGSNNFRVGLEASLYGYHFDKFVCHVNIRLFQWVGEDFS